MREPAILGTLRRKRAAIMEALEAYSKLADAARADIAAIDATLALYAPPAPGEARAYSNLDALFAPGELRSLCVGRLRDGPTTVARLSLHIMRGKGMNEADIVLRQALSLRMGYELGKLRRRGRLRVIGRKDNGFIWAMAE